MWQIDFKKLIVWLIPTYLRRPNFLLLVSSCNWALRQKYEDYKRFVTNTNYRLDHNSQKCYLRAVLNDAFDFTLRRIQIDNFNALQKYYLWPDEDKRDIDISETIFLWDDASYGDSGIDITVFIPVDIVTSDNDLKRLDALMKLYALPDKEYNIVRI